RQRAVEIPQEQGKVLVRAAATCRVRPRGEAPRTRRAHRNPDLLERAPVIRSALVAEEPAAVGLLEREIHLEPAPVRAARIGPAALVGGYAQPGREIGRVFRLPPRAMRATVPAPFELME